MKNFKFYALICCGLLLLPLVFDAQRAYAVVPYTQGDVFAAMTSAVIKHFSSIGALEDTLNSGSGSAFQTGMCFDAAGNLYATNFAAGNMTKFDNKGDILQVPWATGFGLYPESCVVDNTGNVYTGEVDGSELIRKFGPNGGIPLATFSPTAEDRGIDWIDLAADQCTMFYTSEGSSVKRFNVCTNTQLPDFATGLARPCFALKIRSNGEVMVACASQVYRFSSTGAVNLTYPIANEYLFAMNLDPDGQSFWTAGYFSGNIYKVDIATGTGTAAPVFNAGGEVYGLAIYGEPRPAPVAIPTLSEWGMIIFGALLFISFAVVMRRRQAV